jgi:hypothetical protein
MKTLKVDIMGGAGKTTLAKFIERGLRAQQAVDGIVEQHETEKRQFLRGAWKEGVDSVDAGEVDFSALKQEARARLAASKA